MSRSGARESISPPSTPPPITRGGGEAPPPFFNTTFSTHRVSPLYVGPEGLTDARLEVLARRLREILVGDVIRGIQIGLESTETPSGQVGALRSVQIRYFQPSALLGGNAPPNSTHLSQQTQGLWIEIRHENAAYIAILLPGQGSNAIAGAPLWQMRPDESYDGAGPTRSHFLQLPLMLLRMPISLKQVIGDWLSMTFDCRVSKLGLGTKTIIAVWEDWIQTMGLSPRGPDFVISLAFNAPLPEPEQRDSDTSADENDPSSNKPGLRTIDVTIQPQDLRRFLRAGQDIPFRQRTPGATWENDPRERRRLAGNNSDDGWAWMAGKDVPDQPFTAALGQYLNHHMGLNMFHPSVRVVQVSCGGFVLGSTKLKIMRVGEPGDDLIEAAWMFVTKLGQRISGDALPAAFG